MQPSGYPSVFNEPRQNSMINHYLILFYRNFLRSRSYFLINIGGLATGLACTLFIFLWVRDEYRIDQFHANDRNLYQMMEHQKYSDHIMTTSSTPGILAENLTQEFPEVKYAAATTWVNSSTLSVKDHNVKAKGFHVGKDFFNIFSYKLVQGRPESVLSDKLSIVISRSLAQRIFGTEANVVGRMVDLQHKKALQVTGVFEDLPPNSSLQFEFVLSFEAFKDENEWVLEWGNNGPSTYIVLHDGTDAAAFEKKVAGYIKTKNEESLVTLFIQRYSDRYLHGSFTNGMPSGGRIEYVRMFSVVAVIILVIACINFMNLSTARSSRKAREVGIKKSIGAQRSALIFQYLCESVLVSFIALLFAIILVSLLMPQFNLITGKEIILSFADLEMCLWCATIALITGLLAGSYPALYLSGFLPAQVLKGEVRGSIGELLARKGLVVFQFSLSVILIVSVIVLHKQIGFLQNKNLGYKRDNLIQFAIEGKVETSLQTFLTEVKRLPGVINASSAGHHFLGRTNNTMGVEWEGKSPDENILFENVASNYGLPETLGVDLADGGFFLPENPADTGKIIFNETAIRVMNLENPIGKHIKLWDEHDLEIIGVVKDFHFTSLHEKVQPLFFRLAPENCWAVLVRMEGGREKEVLASLGALYKSFNPGFNFEFEFQDEQYAKMYEAEQRVTTLSGCFAFMAIVISSLGLFGLANFTAERRLKEIGIRKALGCSSVRIVFLLTTDFSRMVITAIAIGIPVSYWLLSRWLERFAFHVDLNPWYFAGAGLIALVIGWATVASQSIRAARSNPVHSLRTG
jgi:putative ABC transport system permease protein